MIAFLLLTPAVFAGSVYINGVRPDVLPEVTVDAPGYRVQVLPTGQTASAAPAGSVRSAAEPTSAGRHPVPGADRIGGTQSTLTIP